MEYPSWREAADRGWPWQEHVCVICGRHFGARYSLAKYCSQACKQTQQRRAYHTGTSLAARLDALEARVAALEEEGKDGDTTRPAVGSDDQAGDGGVVTEVADGHHLAHTPLTRPP